MGVENVEMILQWMARPDHLLDLFELSLRVPNRGFETTEFPGNLLGFENALRIDLRGQALQRNHLAYGDAPGNPESLHHLVGVIIKGLDKVRGPFSVNLLRGPHLQSVA